MNRLVGAAVPRAMIKTHTEPATLLSRARTLLLGGTFITDDEDVP